MAYVMYREAKGRVISGHGVASGRSEDPRFPSGTIALQAKIFRERGVDLADLIGANPFMGTINVDVSPATPVVIEPEIALPDVTWCETAPAENFWLFRAVIEHANTSYPALIYMPDPATKPEHFQPSSVVEVIAAPISTLCVGNMVKLSVDDTFLHLAASGHADMSKPR